jgi:ribosome recycling factor
MSEDDKYQYLDELDNYAAEINKQMEEMREEKETELMKV